MRNITPRQLSLYSALLLTGCVSALLFIDFFISFGRFQLLALVSSIIIVYLFSYYIFKQALDQFIYRKIKLIYKTIHQLKAKTQSNSLREKINNSPDVISEVNNEVLIWARDKKEEIDELKKLEEYRKEFIGNLSHELKTPIFNIQGYLSTLIESGLDDKEVAEKYLHNAEKNVERMISLVEDLDTIHKLESHRMHLDFEKFDVVALSKEVLDIMEMKARQRKVNIQYKEEYRSPIWVYADKNTIKQVFTNLILNSIVYGNENGSTKISFYDMDEHILCEIADDGPGIEEKHLARLFERFYRVDKSRSRHQGGTGLGLSIVKHIIEAHQQTINVRSTVGRGATFSFTLRKFKV
ncbi:MAG: sensor histidine kinase [Candidatus Competibacteraceae bacterium]|nr:sensor histidine kinase [Candidatus Competibacteraceae bacterium]